jgi:hypothetical protein
MGGECCGDIASVAAGSGQLFALDQAFVFDGTNRRTIVLTSRDGFDWQTFELPDSFTGSALSIAQDGRLLALGSALSEDVPAPAIFAVASSSSATSLTRPEAIAAAREFALLGESTKVLAADQGPFRQFDPSPNPKASSPPPDTLVWRVIFETGDSGQIRIVTLDAHSGELIETMAAIAN